jgi:polysaccharide export outer membrane protein
VEVYGSEELTRTVRITASGEFSLPLVGRIQAMGLTVGELQDAITKQLAARYFENPQVSVFVKEYMSQRVTVEGAVRTPGVVSLTGRTSLLQVVALSGGLDRDANPGGIVIYRSIGERRHAAVFDLRKVRSGEIVDPEVLGSDVVVVDYSGVRSSLRDFLSATPLLAVFLTAL